MKVFDKRTNGQVTFEEGENGSYLITTPEGIKKNISHATLIRWYKAFDEEGNSTSFPVVVRVVPEKSFPSKKEVDPAKEAEKARLKLEKAESDVHLKLEKAKAAARLKLEKAEAKKLDDDIKKAQKEQKKKERSERLSVAKTQLAAVPSPLEVLVVSDSLVNTTAKAKHYLNIIKVGTVELLIKDEQNHNGRTTIGVDVKNSAGELLYKSPKASVRDCINWLNSDNKYSAEQIAAINHAIRQERRNNLVEFGAGIFAVEVAE